MQGLKALAFEAFCKEKNLSFTRFDYNGHGMSEGQFEQGDIGSWADDALAIFDHIAHKYSRVIIIGSSMGAWIATLIAKQRASRLAGLITLAAAPDFTEILLLPSLSDEQRTVLNNGGTIHLPTRYDDSPYPVSANLINNSKAHTVLDKPFTLSVPVRLIHGTSDMDVPHEMSSRLMETIQSDDTILTLIKNSDHRLSTESELKTITQIIQSILP